MKLKKEAFMRMFADGVMLNGAALLGFAIRFALASDANDRSIPSSFSSFVLSRLPTLTLLNVIFFIAFLLFGVYTRGRSYKGSYKSVVILQAVSVTFLLLGTFCYVLPDLFPFSIFGWIVTYLLTALLTCGARIWMASLSAQALEHKTITGLAVNRKEEKLILVIGGAGYIGSGLLKKLLDKGYSVRLVDAFMFGEEPIQDIINHPRLEVIKADFRQIDKIVQAMYGVNSVIHLGAIVGDPACALDETFTIEVNLMATRMIAECAKGFGVEKFIFASTCSVYGASEEILDEKSALKPVSLYARSKIACEKILVELTDEKFRPTILRFGTVYGLSGRTRFDLVVNLLTAKAIVDGKITVFGEDQWRPFVHVDDASLAVATALEAPIAVAGGEIFNVGSDDGNMTLGQVGRLIKSLVPTAELIASGSDGDRRNYRVDFSKISNRLKYQPKWTVEQGVKQVIEAFDSGKVSDYQSTMYSNVKFLTEEAERTGLKTDSERMRQLVEESVDQVISMN